MRYQYDYDVKEDLIELLQEKNNFSGQPELEHYLQVYRNENIVVQLSRQKSKLFIMN